MIMKIWLWVFEFRMKRVRDDKKIEFLTKQLLNELESQGHSLHSTRDIYGFDVNIYTSSNKLKIGNIVSKWEIICGTYEHKIKEVL